MRSFVLNRLAHMDLSTVELLVGLAIVALIIDPKKALAEEGAGTESVPGRRFGRSIALRAVSASAALDRGHRA